MYWSFQFFFEIGKEFYVIIIIIIIIIIIPHEFFSPELAGGISRESE